MDDTTPRFMRHDDVPPPSGFWLQCSHPAWPAGVAAVVLTLLALGGLALPWIDGAPGWAYAFPLLWSLVMCLIARLSWGTYRAALQPTNWALRADNRGLFLKIRSYLNHAIETDEPDVLFVPRAAVAWLRDNRQTVERHDSDGTTRQRQQYLDIKLVDGTDLKPIKAQLNTERGLWKRARFGRSRHGHYPVSVARGGRLRVAWRADCSSLRPRLDKALALLARWYPIEAARDAGLIERETQILELAQAGKVIDAVKLSRIHYGLSTTEAKAFVNELRGR